MKNATPHRAALINFEAHLKAQGLVPSVIVNYLYEVRRFLRFVGNGPINRISEAQAREFFDAIAGKHYKRQCASIISRFLTFTAAQLPVVVNARGAEMAPLPRQSEKEVALRTNWALDKLTEEKERGEDLIAKLGRRVIDHYLYFQSRLRGEPENLDDIVRFADDCRQLIESNLPLFMGLSAGGRNIHSAIDEKVQR